ncbi:MAG: NAD(P)/FAD-dependent oxidoreductase [Acidobacteriales bacterium]|nr:NAD(P)/FAD-dependent oxidoreductase [Terriglobales bacterium]
MAGTRSRMGPVHIFDLIVAGGGPAGTSAAIMAAQSGAQVLLLEAGRFPRQKVCGEFVSAESLALLAALLRADQKDLLDTAIPITTGRFFFDQRAVATQIIPPAASIARLDLDAALWGSAEAAGVDARLQVRVKNISGSSPFTVSTSDGEFESRAVIDASGRWSNLNAATTPDGQQKEIWLGLKAHFLDPCAEASVDLYFFDAGYCGIQPVSLVADRKESAGYGRINACAMVRANVARSLPEVFARHPALSKRSCDWKLLGQPVSTSPLVFRDPRPLGNGILCVGDAAAFVDPFIGDGISLALRSGTLAAQCLVPFFQGACSLPDATQAYEEAYRKRFGPVFSRSSKVRRLLSLRQPLRAPFVFLLRKAPAITRYVIRKTR